MEWRASHILIKERGQAQELLRKVKQGARFETLARDYSTCPSKSKGGDLGWFGEGKMVPQFEAAVKRMEISPVVFVVMGSISDLAVMDEAVAILKKFDIPHEITVASAHRNPARVIQIASNAGKNGIKVIIAGAGHAAHLAGVIAAHTILPVIGVPIDSSCLQGIDSLFSTLQMPPGIPVATMAVGKSGAKNAGILAAQMLALVDPRLSKILDNYKKEMALQVEKKAEELKAY